MTLLEETRTRLKALPRGTTLSSIADKCEVSIAWLSRFDNGKIDNPGIVQVQRLCDYLRSLEA